MIPFSRGIQRFCIYTITDIFLRTKKGNKCSTAPIFAQALCIILGGKCSVKNICIWQPLKKLFPFISPLKIFLCFTNFRLPHEKSFWELEKKLGMNRVMKGITMNTFFIPGRQSIAKDLEQGQKVLPLIKLKFSVAGPSKAIDAQN